MALLFLLDRQSIRGSFILRYAALYYLSSKALFSLSDNLCVASTLDLQ